jgi:hypothetical protein
MKGKILRLFNSKITTGLVVLFLIFSFFLLFKNHFSPKASAAADSSLSYIPSSTAVDIGSDFTLDAVVDPGSHQVSTVSLRITYDQTKLSLDSISAGSSFPQFLGGSTTAPGNGTAYFSVGTAYGSNIEGMTAQVATLHFHALAVVTDSVVAFTTAPTNPHSIVAGDDDPGINELGSTTFALVTVTSSDATSPTGGSITYLDGYSTAPSLSLVVNDGTDPDSGINIYSRTVEKKESTLTAGTCVSFGSWGTITATGTYPNLTDATVASNKCYMYRYTVADNAGNTAPYTNANVAKIDSTSPSGGSMTYTDGYYTSLSVGLTASDGTDTGSGLNTSLRVVKRRESTLTAGTCVSFGSWGTITPAGTYPDFTDTTIEDGHCYQYQHLISDNVGNQATYTGTSTAKIDTDTPSVTGFTLPDTAASLTVSVASFTATDTAGVTGYMLTESSTAPSAGAPGWSSTAPSSHTFSSAGAKTLYAWAKDGAGHVSTSLNDSVTITLKHTIGGTISGLSGTVVLQNNGGNNLSRSANGLFTFSTSLDDGSTYVVTILTQPAGQTCTLASESGTISAANITDITVTCTNNDSSAPVISDGSPSGTLDYGTTAATLSVTTDESADCRYSTAPNIDYSDTANNDDFTTTGTTDHEQDISGLTNGTSYHYYVRCEDSSSNANGSDYTISFSVASSVADQSDNTDISKPKIKVGSVTESFDHSKSAYSKSRSFKLKGDDNALANGRVEIYKNGDSWKSVTASADGSWSRSVKVNDDKDYKFKFYYYDQDNHELGHTGNYTVKVDSKKPEFTDLPLFLHKRTGNKVWWKAEDNDKISYYKYTLGGKTVKTKEESFIMPSLSWGPHVLNISVFDKAGNKTSRSVLITVW